MVLLALPAGQAFADGYKVFAPAQDVTIGINSFTGNKRATGAMGTARSEPIVPPTINKWIGCWLDLGVGFAMLTCQAVNATDQVDCSTTDPLILTAASAINSDSKITFETPVEGRFANECVQITIDNASKYNVKSP